jgi:hypothetical protein
MPRKSPKDGDVFRTKLREYHEKFEKEGRERKPGRYTASETGARQLASNRLRYYAREVDKAYEKMQKEKKAKYWRENWA